MSKDNRDDPTQDDVEHVSALLRDMDTNFRGRFREATEFKPGELTSEEEEFVERQGLNALNYIPKKTLQNRPRVSRNTKKKMRKRAEILSRPKTDPERIELEREELARDLRRAFQDRFDGFGYGMFLLLILGLTYIVIASYGWGMGIFSGVLMFAILELSYRLYSRH